MIAKEEKYHAVRGLSVDYSGTKRQATQWIKHRNSLDAAALYEGVTIGYSRWELLSDSELAHRIKTEERIDEVATMPTIRRAVAEIQAHAHSIAQPILAENAADLIARDIARVYVTGQTTTVRHDANLITLMRVIPGLSPANRPEVRVARWIVSADRTPVIVARTY